MIALAPVGDDIVLTVERKYPPTNPNIPFALFNDCNDPDFTPISVTQGCYVINPSMGSGVIGDCALESGTVAVEAGVWSEIKALYR